MELKAHERTVILEHEAGYPLTAGMEEEDHSFIWNALLLLSEGIPAGTPVCKIVRGTSGDH